MVVLPDNCTSFLLQFALTGCTKLLHCTRLLSRMLHGTNLGRSKRVDLRHCYRAVFCALILVSSWNTADLNTAINHLVYKPTEKYENSQNPVRTLRVCWKGKLVMLKMSINALKMSCQQPNISLHLHRPTEIPACRRLVKISFTVEERINLCSLQSTCDKQHGCVCRVRIWFGERWRLYNMWGCVPSLVSSVVRHPQQCTCHLCWTDAESTSHSLQCSADFCIAVLLQWVLRMSVQFF